MPNQNIIGVLGLRILFVALLLTFLVVPVYSTENVQVLDSKIDYSDIVEVVVEKIDPEIFEEPTEIVEVVVELSKETKIEDLSQEDVKETELGNFVALKIKKSDLDQLEQLDSVEKISLEREYTLANDVSIPLINADDVWSLGYNGSGVRICILDTGVDKTHPALNVVAEKDFVTDDSDGDDPDDFHGHGTHVAGIAASNDTTYRGVAFEAEILNGKVFNSDSVTASDSDIMAAIDWCIANNSHIISMSLGASGINDGSGVLDQYVDLAVDKGQIITIAAGNSGSSAGSIECPACAHKAIAVGNTYKQNYGVFGWGSCSDSPASEDLITCTSSRGPTSDGRVLPDVTAPGALITSASPGGGWTGRGGTSMSTPAVAGLVALTLNAKPDLTPEAIKVLLMNTANDLGSVKKDNTYGAGRVNATKIIDQINNTIISNISNEYLVHNIFVPDGETIQSTLYWPENYTTHNDLDFYLLDPAGIIRDSSVGSTTVTEMIRTTSTIEGNWKLLVNPFDVTNSQNYAIASNYKPSEQLFITVENTTVETYHYVNITENTTFSLDWNSTDVSSRLFVYNITGQFIGSGSGSSTSKQFNITDPEPGRWILKVKHFGNEPLFYSITSNARVEDKQVDTTAPNLTLIHPMNITYETKNISVRYHVSDLGLEINCTRTINETSVIQILIDNSTAEYNFTTVDGTHSSSVTCKDDQNNTVLAEVNFSVNINPNASFVNITPNDINLTNSDSIIISAETHLADTVKLEWNGTNETISGNGTHFSSLKENLTDGLYQFRFYLNDSKGIEAPSNTYWINVNVTRTLDINESNSSFTILNEDGTEANLSNLKTFENYTIQFERDGVLVQTEDFDLENIDTDAIVNITDSITDEANVIQAFTDTGKVFETYIWIDFNNLVQGNFTAKVIFPEIYSTFYYINGTQDNVTMILADLCNINLTNLPCYVTDTVSTLYLPSFSGAAAGNDPPPVITTTIVSSSSGGSSSSSSGGIFIPRIENSTTPTTTTVYVPETTTTTTLPRLTTENVEVNTPTGQVTVSPTQVTIITVLVIIGGYLIIRRMNNKKSNITFSQIFRRK